jgi:fatty-acyl-CoA synthase
MAQLDDGSPASEAYAYPLLIKQLWHAPLQYAAEQEIVYKDQLRLTYRELRERVGQLGNLLASLSVKHGDVVAMMDWDSHRYLECFFAVPMYGAVLQTVNVRLSPEQILYTLNHAGASVLVVHSDFLPIVREIMPRLTSVKSYLWISDEGEPAPDGIPWAGAYEALRSSFRPDYVFPDFDENTRATTFYTTGTTGLPKGVFFTHRQLVLHTIAGMAALASPATSQRFHRGDVYMPITPMFHVHAWGVPFMALQLGVKQVYPGRYVPDRLLALIVKEKVTFSHCVPTILQMLLSDPGAKSVDLSGMKMIIGGSAMSVGLAKQARARGIDVFGGYGMSETCPLLTIAQLHPNLSELDDERELHFRCKAGAPVPLVELRVVDHDLRDVPDDGQSTGEVVVRAPWLTQGYLDNPQASRELWHGGYLHTQDIGFREQGYFKITDRLKDVIKTGGEWVSSLEIEDLISRHEAVLECAVIGLPDDKWGERPLALVVRRPGGVLDEAELKQHLAAFAQQGTISRYAVPGRVVFVDAIAKTSVGKIDKKLLREQHGQG